MCVHLILGVEMMMQLVAVKDRLQTYHKHEQDLLNFYEQTPFSVKEFMVEKHLEDVFEEFKKLVESMVYDYHQK